MGESKTDRDRGREPLTTYTRVSLALGHCQQQGCDGGGGGGSGQQKEGGEKEQTYDSESSFFSFTVPGTSILSQTGFHYLVMFVTWLKNWKI